MPRDFFDPTPEQQNVVLVDAAMIQKAQRMIAGCEACSGIFICCQYGERPLVFLLKKGKI